MNEASGTVFRKRHSQGFLPPAENVYKAGLPAPLGCVNCGNEAIARAVGATNRAELKPALAGSRVNRQASPST